MSNENRGVSYGFAPHGRMSQLDAERLVRPQVNKEATPPASHESPISSNANWAWLLIGVLLGAGGTLIVSSFWLQGSYVNPSVAMDTAPVGASADAYVDRRENVQSGPMSTDVLRSVKTVDDDAVSPLGDKTRQVAGLRSSDGEPTASSSEKERVEPVKPPSEKISRTLTSAKAETVSSANKDEALLVSSNKADSAADQKPVMDVQVQGTPQAGGSRQSGRDDDIRIADRGALSQTSEPETGASKKEPSFAAPGSNGASPSIEKPASVQLANVIRTVNNADKVKRTAATRRSSRRIYRVQLAAVDSRTSAQVYWKDAQTRLPILFNEVEPIFDRREVDRRVFFRIWIGEFDNRVDATGYCDQVKSEGQDCFVTRG